MKFGQSGMGQVSAQVLIFLFDYADLESFLMIDSTGQCLLLTGNPVNYILVVY